ncbi:transporter substrate-binding domain-containing protein [Pseudodonghicola flavimaris]|uniref:Transporter substrate-binding domain-containing protein n=1 Tax=Pseudodonghicola flavimaris TaxID=3050036 RepID=A0ABT7F0U3_9RHOB|nr:transporter substrate-binding domain-containing protein [Pseudodonghicola flavimaris]MDK3018207.1 transporter substrate-binding domain-containing protein [Pseudodonghicola flavimaris]
MIARLFGGCLGLILTLWAATATAETPEQGLERLLDDLRAGMPATCGAPEPDRLLQVLCSGKLRIGVRDNYPLFATEAGGHRTGYDIEVARALAAHLGVVAEWVPVRPATRISTLAEGAADVVIATMGHNTRRDTEARFIRPHYYRSETIIVGPRDVAVSDWDDLRSRTVCTTIGNYANAHIVSRDVRVMLFDSASRLPEALRNGTCRFVAHDDSFFASYLRTGPIAEAFDRKFGFDPVPWGMAVAATGSTELARALDLISEIMHRDGEFLALARQSGIFTAFLEEQQRLWQSRACSETPQSCLIPALNAVPPPTAFAPRVEQVLAWTERNLGFSPSLPMLMTQPAWDLFLAGIVNSLVLVFGALVATLVFSVGVGALSALPFRLTRALSWLIVVALQSSPVLLTLVVVTAVAHVLFTYSSGVALGAAIVALGLMNGANAGQAIGEAAESLRREQGLGRSLTLPLFGAAMSRSLTQILSFLVNAAKGTPVASFTGAPELLAALTDITSFSSGRGDTYAIVLVFYLGVVSLVVWASTRTRRAIERRRAGA